MNDSNGGRVGFRLFTRGCKSVSRVGRRRLVQLSTFLRSCIAGRIGRRGWFCSRSVSYEKVYVS